MILFSPIISYFTRRAIDLHAVGTLWRGMRQFIWLCVLVTLVSLVGVATFHHFVGIGTSILLLWLLGYLAATWFLGTLHSTYGQLLNVLGHRSRYVLFANFAAWTGLGFALFFTRTLGARAEHWMEGILLGMIVATGLSGLSLMKVADSRAPGDAVYASETVAALSFSWPMMVSTLFYWFQTNGFKFLLVRHADVSTVGMFSVGLSLALAPMLTADGVFTEYWRPVFYRDITSKDEASTVAAWNRYATSYFPSILPLAVFVGFGGPFLARVLVSSQYHHVAVLTLCGALLQACFMIYSSYCSLAFALLETKALILPNILGAMVVALGIVAFASSSPLLGTAGALLGGAFVTCCMTAAHFGKRLPVRVPFRAMLFSLLVSLPMAVALLLAYHSRPDPSLSRAVWCLAAAGCYLALVEWVLLSGPRNVVTRPPLTHYPAQAPGPFPPTVATGSARPRISVLMPVFNDERYIRRAVESICNQYFEDWEMIVVNDGSTDRTAEVLSQISDSRIRVLHRRNAGIATALNEALALARGEYIARMDSDDVSHPERFKEQVAFLDAHPECGLLGSSCEVVSESGERLFTFRAPVTDSAIRRAMCWSNPFVHSSMLLRRAALLRSGAWAEEFSGAAEDYDLWFRLMRVCRAHNLASLLLSRTDRIGSGGRQRKSRHYWVNLMIQGRAFRADRPRPLALLGMAASAAAFVAHRTVEGVLTLRTMQRETS
jgi:hypothetical protein